jgi:hypothetical protein
VAAYGHLMTHYQAIWMPTWQPGSAVAFPFAVLALAAIAGTTWLAARLTAWEAAYRGLRLPLRVVKRGLYYHAAHYVPVALLAVAVVFGYRWLIAAGCVNIFESMQRYLYSLAGAVIVSAGYLFKTYWIGMRNMMYANR